MIISDILIFFFSSRRRHTRYWRDWSSDVCSSDLGYLGEVGPALRYVAWRGDRGRRRITLELPVRAVFSTDLSDLDFRGFTLAPEAAFEHVGLFHRAARTRVGVGPVFASGLLSDYFYKVEDRYARLRRP